MHSPNPESESGRLADRANRLYWDTDRSAADVARELGISRSRLYALVQALPTGQACPECRATLVYSNRTEREAERGRCPECGATAEIEIAAPSPPADAGEAPAEEADRTAIDAASSLLVGAAAGLAAGFLAGAWFRRH